MIKNKVKLSLTQKVALTSIFLFFLTSASVGYLVSTSIRNAYLTEQQREIALSVQNQAHRHLTADDFKKINNDNFRDFRMEISTPDTVRIKVYDTNGVILFSDKEELIGQVDTTDNKEFDDALRGLTTANISKPDKEENIYEQSFDELLEIYVPIVFDDSTVTGVVETYIQLSSLTIEIKNSQIKATILSAAIISSAFIILFIIVKNASKTLIKQDKQLKLDIEKEREYSSLKDEFINLASHQLRTPATGIKWAIETNDLKTAKLKTDEMITIINSLLTLSELKPDYYKYEKKAFSLTQLLEKILREKRKSAQEKKQDIIFEADNGDFQTKIKKEAVTKIFNVLVQNAIDYSKKDSQIKILLKKSPKKIIFEILDHGIGIPEPERSKVFEKFFRASNAIEGRNAGSGLSLYIASTIARGFKGKLSYKSINKGTKFVLELPL
jgi:signal transduction histidine kinase